MVHSLMAWLVIVLMFVSFNGSQCFVAYDLNRSDDAYCSDYEMLIINTKQCVARCPIVCQRGVCFENGTCPCDGAYLGSCKTGLICAAECVPGCVSSGGYCASKTLCLCRKGYVFDALQRRCKKLHHTLLKDRCRGQCLFGKCDYNGQCVCAEGYVYTATLFGQLCRPLCNMDCGHNGYCFLPNMCACRKKHHHYGPDGKCQPDVFY